MDELSLVDYAFHGYLSLWKNIVPAGYEPMEAQCGLGHSPIYFLIMVGLKFLIKTFGLHFWSVRLMSCLGGLFGLILFCSLLEKSFGKKAFCFLGLGFTQLFFYVTHSVRPEGVIFFIGMINLWWVFKRAGVVSGLIAGILFGLAAGIHPEIILFVLPMSAAIVTHYLSGELAKNKIVLWITGCFIGALCVLYFSDLKLAFVYSKLNYGGQKAFVLPFAYWKWNLFGLIDAGVEKLATSTYYWKNPMLGFLWAYFSASLIYCCLWFREMRGSEKKVIFICLSFLLGYFLFNGSPTRVYQIFLLPWVCLCAVKFTVALFHREKMPQNAGLAMGLLGAYLVTKSVYAPFFAFSAPIFLRVVLPHRPNKAGVIFFMLLILVGVANFYTFTYLYGHFIPYFRLKPLWILVAVSWPWIFIKSVDHRWELRFPLPGISNRLPFFACAGMLIVWGGFEIRGLARDQFVSNAVSDRVSSLIASLAHEPRILGPGEWWFMNSNLPVRDSNKMVAYLTTESHADARRLFLMFRPTKAYWPIDRKGLLSGVNEKFEKPVFTFNAVIDLPYGKWVEVTCDYRLLSQMVSN